MGDFFKTDMDIKKHYMKAHKTKFIPDPQSKKSSDVHYESEETDVPGLVNISELSLEELRGKKISTNQAKSIKGTFMLYNEGSKLHECELCDYKREWRGNLQFHVLSEHYDVYLYRFGDSQH